MGGHDGCEVLSCSLCTLRSELDAVRRHGVHQVSEAAMPSLVAVLRSMDPSRALPLHEALVRVLTEIIAPWGDGAAARAARCTFGLTAHTRRQAGHVRRREAAAVMGVSPETFRKGRERDLLDDVAAALVVRDAERPASPVPAPRSGGDGDPVRMSTLDREQEYSLRALLEDARTVLVQGKNWVNLFNQQGARLADAVRRGGSVRVLLVPPDPALATGLYRASAEASARILVDNVRASLGHLADLRAELGTAGERVQCRLADIVPQYGFIATGDGGGVDRGLVQIGFAHTRRGADRFVLCLPEGDALAGFVAEFEAAWEHGSVEVVPQ